ncbi:uncharacterized protein LOC130747958 [Lotus japonicus]|uniref:uncharacterized protein LOC130747958 n=1 Tax=Lotus japonicus TaxID=34305 RepID=UPI002587ABD2|nr:uncharacterized protein LOC130747958 [Lotus japonicus]
MNTTRKDEAERLLEFAEQRLQKHDLKGSRQLAIIAQDTEPLLEGSDQILAIIDVLEASKKKPLNTNNNIDYYAILQVDHWNSQDLNLIKKQYRRLALLLDPDRNLFSFSHHTFKLVSHAWSLLSDPVQKQIYDMGLNRGMGSFWTTCPYCYHMYEYLVVYEGCFIRCQKCTRPFHGARVRSMPQMVPGQEAYYFSSGSSPTGLEFKRLENGGRIQQPTKATMTTPVPNVASAPRKRGRPRKVVV